MSQFLDVRVIKKSGMGFYDMVLQLQNIKPILENELVQLGNFTKSQMGLVIKQNKKRPGSDNVLEGAIKVYKEPTDTGVKIGIGKTDELNTLAPYWYFINYGISQNGMVIPARGKFVPGYFGDHNPPEAGYAGLSSMMGGSIGEQFHYVKGGQGNYFMQPKNPISPMNYIEKTVAWVNSIYKITCDKISGEIKLQKNRGIGDINVMGTSSPKLGISVFGSYSQGY